MAESKSESGAAQSVLSRSLGSLLPPLPAELVRAGQVGYAVGKALVDTLDWSWLVLFWFRAGPGGPLRPVLLGCPPRPLRTPSDENLPVPVSVSDQAKPGEGKAGAGAATETDEDDRLPAPEWVVPCYEDERMTVRFWRDLFRAVPDPRAALDGFRSGAEWARDGPAPVRMVFGTDAEADAEGGGEDEPLVAGNGPQMIRQLLCASLSRDGSCSYVVVRDGFINRAVRRAGPPTGEATGEAETREEESEEAGEGEEGEAKGKTSA